MPLMRYFINKGGNHAQHLQWGVSEVSSEFATVRYSEVETVSFAFSHSMHSTNFVKNDDTISYFIAINHLFITRSHSAFNRYSSGAKSIGEEIRQEFDSHMNNVYRYIVPGLFVRKATELAAKGRVDIASLVFKSDGTVVVDGVTRRISELDFRLQNGQWVIKSKTAKTLFGKPKQISSITFAEENAILIEPMLKLLNV